MLGVKLAQVMVIKVKADEERRLESEREALFADLEESLSPELALRVISEHRRKSSARNSEAALDLLPALRPSAVAPSIPPDVARSIARLLPLRQDPLCLAVGVERSHVLANSRV